MSVLVVNKKYMAIAKELYVDVFDFVSHVIINIPITLKQNEKDQISDIALSMDSRHLAVMTASTKQLVVYELPHLENRKCFIIPRSASRIRFTVDNTQILVADKSGDVLLYDLNEEKPGTKLLGHLSLLLDVLQTNDARFIISSDRDEKIKVSCYPNTYNIQTYCLGHKEFVNHLELLTHNDKYLTSTSGDGTVKIWDYTEGILCHTINTYEDVNDAHLKENFIKMMDDGGIEVSNLPIVHYTITKLNNNSSLIAITVHSCNAILVYSIESAVHFTHKLLDKLCLDRFPTAIQFNDTDLFVYNDLDYNVAVYKLSESNENISLKLDSKIKVFENINLQSETKESQFESIKVLYKRKFDNVQEYQERKKQRLEKCIK